MDGVIQGGWEWVAAAWGISLALLLTYAIALEVRLRRARNGATDDPRARAAVAVTCR